MTCTPVHIGILLDVSGSMENIFKKHAKDFKDK